MVNALLEKPQYVEELAERLNLAASTVSFHLKKLEEARLVNKEKQQYYVLFSLNPAIFQLTLAELVAFENGEKAFQEKRIDQYRQKVIGTFFQQGKLMKFPAQHKKRWIVLETIAQKFEAGRQYSEAEVTAIILEFNDDYCTIRRELIDEKILQRDGQNYWLNEPKKVDRISLFSFEHSFQERQKTRGSATETGKNTKRSCEMNRKQVLKNSYKQQQFPMGIFQLKNLKNGKILIGSSVNLPAMWNRLQAQLKFGSHLNPILQQEWREFGPENFRYDVLEALEPHSASPTFNYADDLALLEEIWLEKLQPFGEKGYNKPLKKS
jgi:hypothetical protein